MNHIYNSLKIIRFKIEIVETEDVLALLALMFSWTVEKGLLLFMPNSITCIRSVSVISRKGGITNPNKFFRPHYKNEKKDNSFLYVIILTEKIQYKVTECDYRFISKKWPGGNTVHKNKQYKNNQLFQNNVKITQMLLC
jgi:hypothetical protein